MYWVRHIRLLTVIATMVSMVAIGLILAVDTDGTRASDDGETEPRVLDADEALERQAEQYAETYDVDLETAIHNLRLQRPAGELQGELIENESDTYAGQYLDHGPNLQLIVWFTEGNEDGINQYVQGTDLEPYVVVRTATHSWDDLQEDREDLRAIMNQVDIEYASETNVRDNQIDV